MSKASEALNTQLIKDLEGLTDELQIKKIATKAYLKLIELYPHEGSLKRFRNEMRKAITDVYPDTPTNEPKPGYYYTESGKGSTPRHEHLALWYISNCDESRWDVVGDEARKQYWENLPKFESKKTVEPVETSDKNIPQKTKKAVEPNSTKLGIKDMNIENLELDTETQEIVKNAIAHSGLDLASFIQNACKVYAKTIMGKAKQSDIDLESISTAELLENSKYRTLPGRAEELSKRAMIAIMNHNDMATEKSQKWYVSASAINELTGCKMSSIKTVIDLAKQTIEDHNTKHGLTAYDNRGRQSSIQDDIKFTEIQKVKLTSLTTPTEQPKQEVKQDIPKIQSRGIVKLSNGEHISTMEIMDTVKANPDKKVVTMQGNRILNSYEYREGKMFDYATGELVAFPH